MITNGETLINETQIHNAAATSKFKQYIKTANFPTPDSSLLVV